MAECISLKLLEAEVIIKDTGKIYTTHMDIASSSGHLEALHWQDASRTFDQVEEGIVCNLLSACIEEEGFRAPSYKEKSKRMIFVVETKQGVKFMIGEGGVEILPIKTADNIASLILGSGTEVVERMRNKLTTVEEIEGIPEAGDIVRIKDVDCFRLDNQEIADDLVYPEAYRRDFVKSSPENMLNDICKVLHRHEDKERGKNFLVVLTRMFGKFAVDEKGVALLRKSTLKKPSAEEQVDVLNTKKETSSHKRKLQELRGHIVKTATLDYDELLKDYGFSDSEVNSIVCEKDDVVITEIRHHLSNKLLTKGKATCSLEDEFNLVVGKTISLRRALGLEIPPIYYNLPHSKGVELTF